MLRALVLLLFWATTWARTAPSSGRDCADDKDPNDADAETAAHQSGSDARVYVPHTLGAA